MNMTTSAAWPAKSSRAYVLPSTAGRRKSGQGAPSSGGGVSTAMARRILAQIGVRVASRRALLAAAGGYGNPPRIPVVKGRQTDTMASDSKTEAAPERFEDILGRLRG